MVPSAVINEAILFTTFLAMRGLVQRTPKEKLPENFRYFTVLSNLFCALTALILLVCELFGAMPAWAVALKYMGAAAVTVTFLTVFLYLLPVTRSLDGLLRGAPEFIMHVVTPVLAIFSFLFFENNEMSVWLIPLALVPVLLYGWLYFNRVVVKKAWDDMYGFNKTGKWQLSFGLMTAGTIAVAVLLYVI